jgi:hypothetical protein
MRNMLKFSLLGAAMFYAAPALAQSTPTDEASTTAQTTAETTIIQPVSIKANHGLQFGKIIRGTGKVTIGSDADTVAVTGDVVALASSTIPTTRANFTITGDGGETVSITGLPSENKVTMKNTNSSDTLDLTLTPDANTAAGTVTLGGAAGTASTVDLNIGGYFDVTSTTPTGAYSGAISLTVSYS